MKKEEMFSRLVENGLDFLFKAKSELKDQPKYSVIHFHAAVELFLKARLMHEHWSLVVSKRQVPDWGKFVTGDFQSVSLHEAANRLDKVVRSPLSKADIAAFLEIAKHRNKMVHFFHEAHSEEESSELTRKIVKQQLKAWYFLHQLLTVQWKDVFSNWQEKIGKIDTALRELHEFLQVVFDNLQPEIKALKARGFIFEQCPSCGFESKQHDDEVKVFYESKCLVCSLAEKCLKIECPSCGKLVTFRNEGFAICQSCGKSLEPKDVANAFVDVGAAYVAAMDGDDSWDTGNCSDCDGYHTVVQTEDDKWVCASCFGEFESLERCSWCNELNTGDMEDSYITGCNHCEGMVGWYKDD